MRNGIKTLLAAGLAIMLVCGAVQAKEAMPPAVDDPVVAQLRRLVDMYARGEVDGLVDGMFKGYDDLMGGSAIPLKTQLRQTRDYYGAVLDHEATEVEIISKRLRRYTVLVHQEKLPIFWYVFVYDVGGEWKVINFSFADLTAILKKS